MDAAHALLDLGVLMGRQESALLTRIPDWENAFRVGLTHGEPHAPEGQTFKSMWRICMHRLFPRHMSDTTNEIQAHRSILSTSHRDPLRGASAGAQHGDAHEDGVLVGDGEDYHEQIDRYPFRRSSPQSYARTRWNGMIARDRASRHRQVIRCRREHGWVWQSGSGSWLR